MFKASSKQSNINIITLCSHLTLLADSDFELGVAVEELKGVEELLEDVFLLNK
jgi:hypothetical protein